MGNMLVTGGAGFIGSHLVDRLLADGHAVTVWDTLTTGRLENVNKKARFYDIDVVGAASCPCHYDVVFHLAAGPRIQPSFSSPHTVHHANVTGTASVLEMVRVSKHVTKVVFASSGSVDYGGFKNPYTFTKHLGEEYCWLYSQVYKLPVRIARLFNVYGPRQIEDGPYATVMGVFERQKRAGVPLTVTGDGRQRRDMVHVDDVVSGLVALAEIPADAVVSPHQLGTGVNHSILHLASMFDHPIEHVPARPGEAEFTVANAAHAKASLGWAAEKKVEDYVRSL